MKKSIFILIMVLSISTVLLASPLEKIDKWALQQSGNFDANDVVNFLKGGKAAGDITYGSKKVFNSEQTAEISTTSLDASHFVVAFRKDSAHNYYGTAIVGTVTGTSISYGSEYVYNADRSDGNQVICLDASHFIVIYEDFNDNYDGTAIIGTVTDTDVIEYGTEYDFHSSGRCMSLAATKLDASHFVATYRNSTTFGGATVITVSPTYVISSGTEKVFNDASTEHISVTSLDATHFVVAYKDGGSSNKGTAIVGTLDGTSISCGSEKVFNDAITDYISVTSLDATHFVVAYRDEGGDDYGCSKVGTVSGTGESASIVFGSESESVFNEANSRYISVASLDASHFVVVYRDDGNNLKGTAIIGKVTDTSISYGSASVFPVGSIAYLNTSTTSLDASHFVVAYADWGNSEYGTAIVGEVEGESSTVTVTGASIAPSGTSPGSTGVGMLKLSFITNTGSATWTAVKVDLTGTAVDVDISSVEIWKDDGNHTWDGSSKADTQIGNGTFSGETATITFGSSETITTTSQDYFVVYNIAGEADPSHTAGAKLLDNSYITVSSPATVSNSGFPIESGLCTLPVELSAFTVQFLNSVPTLYWRTASENDNIGWYIYRNSFDNNFHNAERITGELIPGYGTTSEPHDYIYTDETMGTEPGDIYWYWIQSIDLGGMVHVFGPRELTITGEPDPGTSDIPKQYGLHQNFPNPFGISDGSTKISFMLPATGLAEVKIYNIHGELVRNLYASMANCDIEVEIFWDGKDENGIEQQTGIYFYQLKVNDTVKEIKRLIILR